MRELERRQKLKRRLYSWPSLIILLLVAGASAKGAYGILLKERESAREAGAAEEKAALLEAREAELTAELKKISTPEGVEEVIKSKFNVARVGERVAVIVDESESAASSTPPRAHWWQRLWDDIIGRQ